MKTVIWRVQFLRLRYAKFESVQSLPRGMPFCHLFHQPFVFNFYQFDTIKESASCYENSAV